MKRKLFATNAETATASGRDVGPYDRRPDEAELWFLPDDGGMRDEDPPLPRADRRPLVDPAEWLAAQDAVSGALADLAFACGALDARLGQAPAGWTQRLALLEVAELSWCAGGRIAPDRLALWLGLRSSATGDDAPALERAAWAWRRLTAGPSPGMNLAAFLGRDPAGEVADLAELLDAAAGLHRVTQAAMMFAAWRMLGHEESRQIEAAVLAARHAAGQGRSSRFLPVALAGPGALRASGPADRRLAAWIDGADRAVRAALLHLDRLQAWSARALAATADLTGRTPPRLVAALASWPLVSAPLAEAETGASRAAVQRNLDILAARGLIREVTGQGRYRMWEARL
jgi:hypothetical protein